MSQSRRASRRAALFMLFQWDVTGKDHGSTYDGELDDFAWQTAKAVAENAEHLDRRIDEATEGWPAGRLGAVERNVLRLAIHELERDEVPAEVAIDEAVRFAKRYASEEAGKLVNGILGRIAREEAA